MSDEVSPTEPRTEYLRSLLAALWPNVVVVGRANDKRAIPPDGIAWMPLGEFPTPVDPIAIDDPRVRAQSVWVKRDDLAGARYGGNKVRKLEFILAHAAATGATRLATIGGIGSHHVLATALYGKAQGFEVAAVVFPQPLNTHVREQLLADAASDLQFYPSSSYLTVPFAYLGARRGRTWIEAGGSSVYGCYGYVVAAAELRRQIDAGELPRPAVIYMALGSCGSVAGLIVGLALAGLTDVRVVAVRVVERIVCNQRKLDRLVHKTLARWPDTRKLPPYAIEHRQIGRAYGASTPAAEAAVAWAAARGMTLEPTYTGKTMAALLADGEAGVLDGKNVLFWNTFSSRPMAPLLAGAPAIDQLPAPLRRYFPASTLPSPGT